MFQKNVITDRVDKCSQPIGLAQAVLLAKSFQDTSEGLLAHIILSLRRLQTGADLQADQLREVADKVLLDAKVSSAKSLDVSGIE